MNRDGQASVEFIVAVLAVALLLAGLVQVSLLTKTHTDLMGEARRLAGANSFQPDLSGRSAEYISEWHEGDDKSSYSADDTYDDGELADFRDKMVDYANPDDLRDRVGDNLLSRLADAPGDIGEGFELGEAKKNVDLIPIINKLVYSKGSIEVKCEVWMTLSGYLY